MHSLDIVRVIVSPRSSHTSWMDMVRDDVRIAGERFFTDCTSAVLLGDLAIHQSSHLSVGSKFTISPRIMRVVDALHAKLCLLSHLWNRLTATAREGAMDRTIFIATEFHGGVLLT